MSSTESAALAARAAPRVLRVATLLASISAIGPFAIDAYLPAFPDIGRDLGASELDLQSSLTAFMLTHAFMTLWYGALADAWGRRRVVLATLVVFSASSGLCAVAPTVEVLWCGRVLQGATAGGGMVVSRAIVRDLKSGVEAQRLMARISMMFALAPAAAPVIGGWLSASFGWRSVFGFLLLGSGGLAAWVYVSLPETLPQSQRQPLRPRQLLEAYRSVFTHRAFLAGALGGTLAFTAYFVYVMSAPVFLMTHLSLAQTDFLWLFGPLTAGMIIGSAIASRASGKMSEGYLVRVGYSISLAAAVLNVAVCIGLPPSVPWSVLPLFLFALGNAMTVPTLQLKGLDLFPERRGLAASCQGTVRALVGALNPAFLAPFLWSSPLRLALGQLALWATAALCIVAFYRWTRVGFTRAAG